MKKVLLLVFTGALLCSCSTSFKSRSARTAELPVQVSLSPTTSDLVVSDVKALGKCNMSEFGKNVMEKEAVASALAATDSDVLLEPSFTYTYKGAKLVEVTVEGYPAKYANFRAVTQKDADILYRLKEPAAVIIKTEVEKNK